MRVLAVVAVLPYPLDEALSIAHDRYLRALSEIADVTVMTWRRSETTEDDIAQVREWAHELVVLPRSDVPFSLPTRLARRARFLVTGVPHYAQAMLAQRRLVQERGVADFQAQIRPRHQEAPFDAIVLGEEVMALAPLPGLGVPVVLHRWNAFAPLERDLHGRSWRRPLVPAEARAWARFERKVNDAADLIVTPTPEVARYIARQSPGAAIAALAHGVECRPLATAPSAGRDVAYIGAMNYAANVDAVEWFASRCWPAIRRAAPDASFRIVGRAPTARVRSLEGGGVRVSGTVADITDACEGTRVGVVPLRAGMGMKTKTLELMGMGLPVVTTSVGAEGIAATPGDGLLVADDPDEMTKVLLELLHDPSRADLLGAAARAYVTTHHSWNDAVRQYCDHVAGLATHWAPA